jgi:hypothetical protein
MYHLFLFNADESQKWELPFQSITITEELNLGVDGQVSISFPSISRYAEALNTDPESILVSAARHWKLYKDTTLLYAGILINRRLAGGQYGATSYVISIGGWDALLARRNTESYVFYDNDDSADIAWAEINRTNTEDDTGITRGTHPTTKNRQRTGIYDNLRDFIIGMSANKVDDGYDWEITPNKVFNIYYAPTLKGTSRPEIVIDSFNRLSFTADRPLQGRLANRVNVLGEGSGQDMVTASVEDSGTPRTTWGLLETTLAQKGVGSTSELEDRGNEYLAKMKSPTEDISVVVRDSSPDITTYAVGDTLTAKIEAINYEQEVRVIKRVLSIEESGEATVTLTFEE